MIDTVNGIVTLCGVNIELSSMLSKDEFVGIFSRDKIQRIRDMRNGYVWFDLNEKLYDEDKPVPIQLCFCPKETLKSIHIYPCYAGENRIWTWTEEGMKKDKKYCDNWLAKFCKLRPSNRFSWGELSSVCDLRSYSSGIVINYFK